MKRLIYLVAASALALSSCGKPPAEVTPARLSVFATLYPLAEISREVGGDSVDTDWLIELGKPLHGFSMTPRERERMAATDLTVCDSYRRTETWAAPDLAQRQNTGSVLTLDNLPATVEPDYPAQGLLELDPVLIKQFVPVLADAFTVARPRKAAVFHAQADAFVQRIDALLAKYPPHADGDRGGVVVLSTTFAPMLYRFGIKSVLADVDAYRFSDEDAAAVAHLAAGAGYTRLVVPFDLPPGAVTRIQTLTGLTVIQLDAVGLSGFKGHDTYLDILGYDLSQLNAGAALTR